MHIALGVGDVGGYVFLPGSPERMEKIAAYFGNPQEIAYNREYRTFVSELGGTRVAVTSTGTDGPSTAIAVEELHQYGMDTMMRVGTYAFISPRVSLGDVIIPSEAVKMEGVNLRYLPVESSLVPDLHMLKYTEQAVKNLDYPYNVGVTIAGASFHIRTGSETKPVEPEFIFKWSTYEEGGATSTDIEYAPLFAIGSCLGIRAVCVIAGVTNYRNYNNNSRNTEIDIGDGVIRTTIEAMRIIIRGDKEMKWSIDYEEVPLSEEVNIPYYVQIYDIIYQLIQENVLQKGDAPPRENILAEYWNVNRSTVCMAARRLEEDGYIYKMQGRKTMVTGQPARSKDGLQHISNPCISSCIDTIAKAETMISAQDGGRPIGDLLGYNGKVFTIMTVNMKYCVGETCVVSSVAIIPVLRLEQERIATDEEEKLKDLALSGPYGRTERSSLSMSAVEWTEGVVDRLQSPITIAMDEVLYEDEAPLTYHKYRVDSNWYRFTLDRRLQDIKPPAFQQLIDNKLNIGGYGK